MTKEKATDKNLQNTAEELDRNPVNSHQAQQLQQDQNDRRRRTALNHKALSDRR